MSRKNVAGYMEIKNFKLIVEIETYIWNFK